MLIWLRRLQWRMGIGEKGTLKATWNVESARCKADCCYRWTASRWRASFDRTWTKPGLGVRPPRASESPPRNIPHSLAATITTNMLTLARYDLGDLGEASWLSIPACTYHDDNDNDNDYPNRQQTDQSLSPRNSLHSHSHSHRPCLTPLPLFRSLLPNTPLILTLALADDAENPASVLPRSAQPVLPIGSPHTEPYPFVYSPCSPHTSFAALPNCLHNPLP